MLTPELLRRIRRIEIKTRRLANEAFVGAYHSVFKGRGMAFESVRPYQPGDDVRDIDWNVTARADQAYIKQYAEERELTVLIVLDGSSSCLFGTVGRTKRELAVEVGAALALTAVANNDKVGLMIFSDQIEMYATPRKGRNHILRIIRDLLAAEPRDAGTDLGLALRSINQMHRRRAVVFLMSDFLAAKEEYERELRITARKHDLIAVMVDDRLEERFPDIGLVQVKDAETNETRWIDTGSQAWRERYTKQSMRFQALRAQTLRQAGVDTITIRADGDYVGVLVRFFERRSKHAL